MAYKIVRTGDDLVLVLPRAITEEAGLTEADEVEIVVDAGRIVITPATLATVDIDPDFTRQIEEFIAYYRPALEALSR